MRVPPNQIGAALSAFYGGASIGDIRRQLEHVYGLYPSKSTIYDWIVKYTRKAVRAMAEFKAHTGDTWVAGGGAKDWGPEYLVLGCHRR